MKINELETIKQKPQPNKSIKLQAISLRKINKFDKLLVKLNRKKRHKIPTSIWKRTNITIVSTYANMITTEYYV